ncbi:MAG: hypothetical protein R6V15_15550 [Desulfotignum sp.]
MGTVYQKQVGGGCNLIAGSFWQYIGMLILMALVAWSFESRTAVWTIELVLSLAWLVCALSVTAILLLMYMIREGETAQTGIKGSARHRFQII